jgi:hypothetical protein
MRFLFARPVSYDNAKRFVSQVIHADTRKGLKVSWDGVHLADVREDAIAVTLPPDGHEFAYLRELDACAVAKTLLHMPHWFKSCAWEEAEVCARFVPTVHAQQCWLSARVRKLRPPTVVWNQEPVSMRTIVKRWSAFHVYNVHVVLRCDGLVFEPRRFYLDWSVEALHVSACSHDEWLQGKVQRAASPEVDVDRTEVDAWLGRRVAARDGVLAARAETLRQEVAAIEERRAELARRWEAAKCLSTDDPQWTQTFEALQEDTCE